MAFLEGNYYSEALKQDVHFVCINPFEERKEGDKEKYLIMLHGLMDNCRSWSLRTNLYRLAAEYGVTVFCPEGHRGFYSDMLYGGKYRRMINKEIPRVLKEMLGITLDGNNTVIAGNSAGGYGALKAVLSEDSLYQKAMAFSPVIDPVQALAVIPEDYLISGEEQAIYGSQIELKKEDDLFELIKAEGLKKKFPLRITVTCGRNDFLIEQNREFQKQIQKSEIGCIYREAEGEHGWDYWDTHLRELFVEYFDEK